MSARIDGHACALKLFFVDNMVKEQKRLESFFKEHELMKQILTSKKAAAVLPAGVSELIQVGHSSSSTSSSFASSSSTSSSSSMPASPLCLSYYLTPIGYPITLDACYTSDILVAVFKSLRTLHTNGICHGDARIPNCLKRTPVTTGKIKKK